MSDRSKTRLYYTACVCLLVVVATLRFWDLPGVPVGHDEAVAANNSRESLGEVLDNTRNRNSSPILYPLVLYVVQKVEISPLSIRIVPAAASVLTVAAILFLLPRVGVSRWAAFVAALLATSSLPSIILARDGREYSIDTLVAVLMIAGLLAYLRGKRGGMYILFCVSLFLAPLVQYGLVLFGIAIFGTIVAIEVKALWGRRSALRDGLRFPGGWVWRRMEYVVLPAACFAAGSVMSYAVTLRYQWIPGGWAGELGDYLSAHYYSGGYGDVPAMIWFALSQTELVLRYHVSADFLPVLWLVGFGIFLIVSLRKARLDGITILLLFSLAVAACAAMIRAYPYGDVRQSLYLGPIIFLAFGHALHSLSVDASSLTRRGWPAYAGMVLASCIIVFSGIAAIWDSDLYRNAPGIEVAIMTLEEQVREEDVVYVSHGLSPMVEFYHEGRRDGYCHGEWGDDSLESCTNRLFSEQPRAERMWLLGEDIFWRVLEPISAEQDGLEFFGRLGGNLLYVWSDPFSEERDAMTLAYQYFANVEPGVRSVFDVHWKEGTLTYVKEPCVLGDVTARFFLHVTPVNVDDLSEERKEHGFDNLDFEFASHGAVLDGRCVAVRDLPEYDIENVSTGQFSDDGRAWQGEFSLGESDALLSAYEYAANSEPTVQSVFDVYKGEGTLIYVKELCVLADAAARFFLHVTPTNVDDLPEERREHGFDNLDFDFASHGIVGEGRCIAVRDLPEYAIERIWTGQFSDERKTWQGEIPFDE